MNEKIQRQIFNLLYKKGIKNFVGVPDSTMKYFIDEGLKKEKILITTREEEAIGIVSGMSLSKLLKFKIFSPFQWQITHSTAFTHLVRTS